MKGCSEKQLKGVAVAHLKLDPSPQSSGAESAPTPAVISDPIEMGDSAQRTGTPIHEPPSPSSRPAEQRRPARRGRPPKRLQSPPPEPSVSKRKPGRPPVSPVSSHPKKRRARNRHLYEWLVEEDDGDEVQT